MKDLFDPSDLEILAQDCLVRAGVDLSTARVVARDVALSEVHTDPDGGFSGLLRDIRLIRYERLLPNAEVEMELAAPSVLRVDAGHGFASAALGRAVPELITMATEQGMAMAHVLRASTPGRMTFGLRALSDAGMAGIAVRSDAPTVVIRPDHTQPVLLDPVDPSGGDMLASLLSLAPPAADSPLDGPVANSGWLTALDPGVTDVGDLLAGLPVSPPASVPRAVALAPELLAEIVNA